MGELVIGIDVGTILLHRILHFQHSGVFACLGIYHTDTVRIFHGEIDVLEYPFPFASRAESIDRNGHACANGNKNQEDVCNHSVIYN